MSEQLSSVNSPEQKQPKDRYMRLYRLGRFAIRATHAITVEGAENILDEPAIYAANHVDFMDSLIISMLVTEKTKKPTRFIIKKEYMEGGGLDGKGRFGKSVMWFMKATQQIPVDRENEDPASILAMIRAAKAVKARGERLGIHPTGTRINDDEGLPEFNPGVGAIALATDEAVVPTGVGGYDQRKHWYNRRPVHVRFGVPIQPEEFATLADPDAVEEEHTRRLTGKEKVSRLTRNLEARVAELLGIHRTHTKAKLRKYRDDE